MEQLAQFFGITGTITLLKTLFIVLMVFHMVFSFVIVRQVARMTHVVEAQVSPAIYTIALLHVAASVVVFLWTILLI